MDSPSLRVRFDRALVAKYDRPGPRYTSYPTAPHFRSDFGVADHARLLETSARRDTPLSLYVHVPFCARRCFFCGCNVQIARERSRGGAYLDLVEREMARAAELLDAPSRKVVQVHWGGGTPTFLDPEDLTRLMAMIRGRFRLAEGCEIGVEVDPRECTPEQLDALAAGGVNRLSMGLQELDPKVQTAVNRVQTLDETRAVLDGARRRGIGSINVDLIYGLPHQTLEGFAATLAAAIEMAPDRLALFNFAYLPQTFKHQRAIDAAALPSADAKLSLLELAIDTLGRAGYVFIGMDHFARPKDPLAKALAEGTLTRNFQGYSTCGETDVVAFGASSISQVGGGYAQNERDLGPYGAAVGRKGLATCRGLTLDGDDELRRDVIMGIMCHFRLEKAEVEAKHGIDFDASFADALARLEPFADDGLVELNSEAIEVTGTGRLLIRNIAMAFDAYLEAAPAVRYSRTV